MSDRLRGLLTVLRRVQTDWSSFNRERIPAAFMLPPGAEVAPMIVDPTEVIEDVRPSDQGEEAAPFGFLPVSDRLYRRLSRRSSFPSERLNSRSDA